MAGKGHTACNSVSFLQALKHAEGKIQKENDLLTVSFITENFYMVLSKEDFSKWIFMSAQICVSGAVLGRTCLWEEWPTPA